MDDVFAAFRMSNAVNWGAVAPTVWLIVPPPVLDPPSSAIACPALIKRTKNRNPATRAPCMASREPSAMPRRLADSYLNARDEVIRPDSQEISRIDWLLARYRITEPNIHYPRTCSTTPSGWRHEDRSRRSGTHRRDGGDPLCARRTRGHGVEFARSRLARAPRRLPRLEGACRHARGRGEIRGSHSACDSLARDR